MAPENAKQPQNNRMISKTVNGFVTAMDESESCRDIRWDEFTEAPVVLKNGRTEQVSDDYRAEIKAELESKFGLYSVSKFEDAFRIFCADPVRRYHPIKERIESIEWDGKSHIASVLVDVLKVDPSAYAVEAARLLFAGGIRRLYEPGCKNDYVVVLIGPRQGEGKSTFLRWLALDDDWYGELKTFDYQKGAEALSGKWIVEIPELAALRKSEVEEVKAFISQQRDHYRRPYERTISDIKRKCVMAGTTNSLQFLSDPTGNRRFLPIEVHSDGSDLYNNEKKVRALIEQCWAEAYHKLKSDFTAPTPNPQLIKRIEQEQERATVDDPNLNLIQSYLDGRDATCVLEVYYDAFGHSTFERPTKADRNEIGLLLQKAGWRRTSGMYSYTKPSISRQAKWVPADAVS